MIHASINVTVIDDPEEIRLAGSTTDKPFIRISNPSGTLELTFNQLGMLFGVARGAAARFIDEGRLPADNVPVALNGEPVLDFAEAIMHGSEEHRSWLLTAAMDFIEGKPVPPPRG